jgi:hypothetical protein
MDADVRAVCQRDLALEAFAAHLTNAAYRVALRHGTATSWVDLELDLWRALAAAVREWRPPLPPDGVARGNGY